MTTADRLKLLNHLRIKFLIIVANIDKEIKELKARTS